MQIKLTFMSIFNRYDFDNDGYVTESDIRLLLLHVPIMNSTSGSAPKEGSYTKNGGGW